MDNNDLITRQSAINAIEDTDCPMSAEEWDELTYAIVAIPAVDAVEVRHARWLRLEKGVFCGWCTFGWKFLTGVPGNVETDYRYCPNCGARMDGRREEENNA